MLALKRAVESRRNVFARDRIAKECYLVSTRTPLAGGSGDKRFSTVEHNYQYRIIFIRLNSYIYIFPIILISSKDI